MIEPRDSSVRVDDNDTMNDGLLGMKRFANPAKAEHALHDCMTFTKTNKRTVFQVLYEGIPAAFQSIFLFVFQIPIIDI